MSSNAQGSGDGQPAGGSSPPGPQRSVTPRTARFQNFQAAHRAITGQTSSDIAPDEYLPDPSDFGDEDVRDSLASTAVDPAAAEQAWFDNEIAAQIANDAFIADSSDEQIPPYGEEIPVSHDGRDAGDNFAPTQADEEEDSLARIYNAYARAQDQGTVSSSGFNSALGRDAAGASSHAASSYRVNPEEIRQGGAAARLGFRNQQVASSLGSDTLYEGSLMEQLLDVRPRPRLSTDTSGPSLPLPHDPPAEALQGDHLVFPDPSVSSVTNSQALLQGGLTSPYVPNYRPHQRQGRNQFPAIPPPLPRRSSRRQASDTRPYQPRASFRRSAVLEDDDDPDLGQPGPAIVRGVLVRDHESDPAHSMSGSQTPSRPAESSHSSARDPFSLDRLFVPASQERVTTSRLREVTRDPSIFSQSPVNSPDRERGEFENVPLNDPPGVQAGPSSSRTRRESTDDYQLAMRAGRDQDDSMIVRSCRCRFHAHHLYSCLWCFEEERVEAARQQQEAIASSPSYRMDRRGIRVGNQPSMLFIDAVRDHPSTERIVYYPAPHAGTTGALQRSQFSTFQPQQRTHRVNGRLPPSPTVPSSGRAPRMLGTSASGSRDRYAFRDSLLEESPYQDAAPRPPRQTPNWRSLTGQDAVTPSAASTTPTLPFQLLPLDEAYRRQAEERASGRLDQTFLSAAPSGSTFRAGRRRATTRGSVPTDSFDAVMQAALGSDDDDDTVAPAAGTNPPTAPATTTTSSFLPSLLRRPRRAFLPRQQPRRYGAITDDDIEMLPVGPPPSASTHGPGTIHPSVDGSNGRRGRAWSSWSEEQRAAVAYRVMMALSLLCPPLALLARLDTFRGSFPAFGTMRRDRLCLAASVVGCLWALAVVVAVVVMTTGSARGASGRGGGGGA